MKHLLRYIEELETDPVNDRGHLKDIKQENDKIWFNVERLLYTINIKIRLGMA